jgi:WS/DGAT/MGAT family acyltransferase
MARALHPNRVSIQHPGAEMHEMAGADAFFLYEETPARHMHTMKIIEVDPSTSQQPLTMERVRQGAALVMPTRRAFRVRPVSIPFGLGHPFWADAPRLDRDYHFRHVLLEAPGGRDEFDALVSRVASTPLARDRPLWQLYFVEGLAGGRAAYMVKIHHAVADGIASAHLVASSFDTAADGRYDLASLTGAVNESVPRRRSLLAAALRREIGRQRDLPRLLARSLRMIRAGIARRRSGSPAPALPFTGPPTRFNRRPTPNRVYAHTTVSLRDLRTCRRAFGCSLNDVFVTLAGGALRRYLAARGELPHAPLTAAVPVSIRGDRDDPHFGNANFIWCVSTGSDTADPEERLRHVVRTTRAARDAFAASDRRLPLDWLEFWALRRMYLVWFPRLAGALLGRPSFNVILSNVPGPREPLYSDGARVTAIRSMGPLTRAQGLNITAWSYLDDFSIGIQACREHVPDVRVLADAFAPELDALVAAAAKRRDPDV